MSSSNDYSIIAYDSYKYTKDVSNILIYDTDDISENMFYDPISKIFINKTNNNKYLFYAKKEDDNEYDITYVLIKLNEDLTPSDISESFTASYIDIYYDEPNDLFYTVYSPYDDSANNPLIKIQKSNLSTSTQQTETKYLFLSQMISSTLSGQKILNNINILVHNNNITILLNFLLGTHEQNIYSVIQYSMGLTGPFSISDSKKKELINLQTTAYYSNNVVLIPGTDRDFYIISDFEDSNTYARTTKIGIYKVTYDSDNSTFSNINLISTDMSNNKVKTVYYSDILDNYIYILARLEDTNSSNVYAIKYDISNNNLYYKSTYAFNTIMNYTNSDLINNINPSMVLTNNGIYISFTTSSYIGDAIISNFSSNTVVFAKLDLDLNENYIIQDFDINDLSYKASTNKITKNDDRNLNYSNINIDASDNVNLLYYDISNAKLYISTYNITQILTEYIIYKNVLIDSSTGLTNDNILSLTPSEIDKLTFNKKIYEITDTLYAGLISNQLDTVSLVPIDFVNYFKKLIKDDYVIETNSSNIIIDTQSVIYDSTGTWTTELSTTLNKLRIEKPIIITSKNFLDIYTNGIYNINIQSPTKITSSDFNIILNKNDNQLSTTTIKSDSYGSININRENIYFIIKKFDNTINFDIVSVNYVITIFDTSVPRIINSLTSFHTSNEYTIIK
jgi:hypothetical protein